MTDEIYYQGEHAIKAIEDGKILRLNENCTTTDVVVIQRSLSYNPDKKFYLVEESQDDR